MVTSLCQLCGNSGALFKKCFNRIQTRWLYDCWLLRYVFTNYGTDFFLELCASVWGLFTPFAQNGRLANVLNYYKRSLTTKAKNNRFASLGSMQLTIKVHNYLKKRRKEHISAWIAWSPSPQHVHHPCYCRCCTATNTTTLLPGVLDGPGWCLRFPKKYVVALPSQVPSHAHGDHILFSFNPFLFFTL